ncbi:hypothetical protein [Nannocystis exedens]|uniref:hypothetical protein n=1 Tax=Nannocystis exedens TaxID=54 RepID=UPI0011807212|nr:hypothetical protein [Nannocystis exedens]
MPADGVAPLAGTLAAPDAAPSSLPTDGLTPLERGTRPPVGSATPLAPFGSGPALPPTAPTDPRTLRAVRIDLLAGPVWRSRTTDAQVLVNLEAGRLQGFSGTFHVGVVVAPDRGIVDAIDLPIGAGFVARRRLGRRSVYGSVGLTAGLLVHRAATDLGLVHRVDPDFQLPLKFAWSAGRVGFSLALLQGFSVRTRTYERRGVEVWKRIPYRIGFAVGLHFDIGVGRAKPRRARSRGL